MIFKFIKYTQPAWQFNLVPKAEGCFPSCCVLEESLTALVLDKNFETPGAQIADAGYRLWNRGVLLESNKKQIEAYHQQAPTLHDEYAFVRKYWGNSWATFAFLLRIGTLKNPIKESKAYVATRKVSCVNSHSSALQYEDFKTFKSSLIESGPLVTVIIPTLNRYGYLQDVLHDLEKQSYQNFDVIVVDQSDNFRNDFYGSFDLRVKVIHQTEKRLWTARNDAIKATDAEYLLFFDDDSRVEPDWIAQHLKCLDYFGADISAGVSLAVSGGKIPASYNHFRWADQFDSGNAMVRRNVFKKIGLFDQQFNCMRMGDGEFGIRTYLNGYKSISNPYAARVHLKVDHGGLREMGSWDSFRSKNLFGPKPVPSVIYLYKKYFPKELYRNALFIGIMLSNVSYKHKRSSNMLLLSVMLTIIKSPLLLIQYLRSHRLAKQLLENNYTPELLKV